MRAYKLDFFMSIKPTWRKSIRDLVTKGIKQSNIYNFLFLSENSRRKEIVVQECTDQVEEKVRRFDYPSRAVFDHPSRD